MDEYATEWFAVERAIQAKEAKSRKMNAIQEAWTWYCAIYYELDYELHREYGDLARRSPIYAREYPYQELLPPCEWNWTTRQWEWVEGMENVY